MAQAKALTQLAYNLAQMDAAATMKTLRIGLIGDRDDAVPAHRAIPPALELAAASLGNARTEPVWLPTETLAGVDPDLLTARLSAFGGLWCVPNSPYVSETGALAGIRYARENGVPFLGTCGGFQHSLLGYARDVLGLFGAQHAEVHPGTDFPLLMRMKCSLDGEGRISLREGSRLRGIYGQAEVSEPYQCNFGLNPEYETRLEDGRLRFVGRDTGGEVRALEIAEHPFYVATLFQFELSALREGATAHPVVRAYLQAVAERMGQHV